MARSPRPGHNCFRNTIRVGEEIIANQCILNTLQENVFRIKTLPAKSRPNINILKTLQNVWGEGRVISSPDTHAAPAPRHLRTDSSPGGPRLSSRTSLQSSPGSPSASVAGTLPPSEP